MESSNYYYNYSPKGLKLYYSKGDYTRVSKKSIPKEILDSIPPDEECFLRKPKDDGLDAFLKKHEFSHDHQRYYYTLNAKGAKMFFFMGKRIPKSKIPEDIVDKIKPLL